MPVRQLSLQFEDQIRIRNRVQIRPPNQERWFRGAYSTLQKTLRRKFAPFTEKQKSRVEQCCGINFLNLMLTI